MNARLIARLCDAPAMTYQRLIQRLNVRMIQEGGHRLGLLPVHFIFDSADGVQLAEAATALVQAQTRIIRHLIEHEGRDGLMERFEVPKGMQRFINWTELTNPTQFVARFDILQSDDGYHFCEFNVDSCVAGAEISEYMVDYFDGLGVTANEHLPIRLPLLDLALLLRDIAHQKQLERVVILDWSIGGGSPGKGYFSFERMRACLARELAPIPIFIANEKTYDRRWIDAQEARRTLVHRGFMMDEMDDQGQFLDELLAAGTTVVNTYESEIRMNKVWFALFHDPLLNAHVLTENERKLIAKYVPRTCEISSQNLHALLAQKDAYIFKAKQSFGGAGILIGDEIDTAALEVALHKNGLGNFVAQEMLRLSPISCPYDADLHCVPSNLVFGLYLYGTRANGMLVRSSRVSRIVNVTAGHAKMAWALAATPQAEQELLAQLARSLSASDC